MSKHRLKIRKTWGSLNPVERVVPDKRGENRWTKQDLEKEFSELVEDEVDLEIPSDYETI